MIGASSGGRGLWCALSTLVALVALGAQPSGASEGDAGPWTQLTDQLRHGTGVLRVFGWLDDESDDDPGVPAELRMRQEADLDLTSRLRLVLAPEYRVDNRHFTAGVLDEAVEEQERRYAVGLREAYLEFSFEHVDVVVGKKIWAWGTADGYNPTDNLNPSDLQDFLLGEKIGVPSISWTWSNLTSSLELVLLPAFTPARLPAEDNRWAIDIDPALLPGPGGEIGGIVRPIERRLPSRSLDNGQLAARFKTSLAGTDVELSYFHGFDPIPFGEVTGLRPLDGPPPNGQSPLGVEVAAVYNEIDEYGVALASTLTGFTWHLEASYRVTAKGYDDDFLTWVLGMNKSWYLGRAVEELFLTLEYVDEAFVHEATGSPRFGTDFNRPFQDSLLANVRAEVGQDLSLAVRTAYNVRDDDFFVEPSVTYRLGDHHELQVGAHLIQGDAGTFWGNWADNDRIYSYYTLFF